MHWKTRSRMAAAAILMGAFVAANADTVSAGDSTVDYSGNDQVMAAAQVDAQRHLDVFLRNSVNGDGYGLPNAALKVALPSKSGGSEVIWVGPFRVSGSRLAGILANEPNELPGLAAGDAVQFTRAQIRDWSIWGEDGRLYGNFTTRAMLAHISIERAAQMRDVLSEEPVPASW